MILSKKSATIPSSRWLIAAEKPGYKSRPETGFMRSKKRIKPKTEPILRQDARQNKDLEEDDVSKKDILL
jgi:hypothetical protein